MPTIDEVLKMVDRINADRKKAAHRYMVRIDCNGMTNDQFETYSNDDTSARAFGIELWGTDGSNIDRWIVSATRPSQARAIVARLLADAPGAEIVSVVRVDSKGAGDDVDR